MTNSKYKVLTLVCMLLKFSVNHGYSLYEELNTQNIEKNYGIAAKICEIAKSAEPMSYILYHFNHSGNWESQYLLNCLGDIPLYNLNFENYSKESERNYSSLSIMRMRSEYQNQIIDFLDEYSKGKNRYHYIFAWVNGNEEQYLNFFKKVWMKKILNVVIVKSENSVYTYEPFSAEGFRLVSLNNRKKYFYDKLRNFYGYQLRISMFQDVLRAFPIKPNTEVRGYTGIDGMIARTTFEKVNATALYMPPVDGKTFGGCDNGTFTGAIKDIAFQQVDFSYNNRFMLGCQFEPTEFIPLNNRRIINLLLPSAPKKSMVGVLLRTLNKQVWLIMLVNITAIILIYTFLLYVQNKRFLLASMIGFIYSMTVRQPLSEMKLKKLKVRCILLSWCLYAYIVTSIYFGQLSSNFVNPLYEKDMESLNELDQLHIPIYCKPNYVSAAKTGMTEEHWALLEDNIIGYDDQDTKDLILGLFMKNANVGFMVYYELGTDIIALTYDSILGRKRYHLVPEYLQDMLSVYVVPRGTPYIDKFKFLLTLYYESGLYKYWQELDQWNSLLESLQMKQFQMEKQLMSVEHTAVLTLELLQGAFYLFAIGVVISIFVFLIEFCWRKK